MMFLLNRSEMDDKVEFDASQYNRDFRAQRNEIQEAWVAVEPAMFQDDAEITAEVGSTLADDDEAKVGKAMMLWQIGSPRPDLFNVQALRDEVLIAHGKGPNLAQFVAPQQPPPEPPMKASLTVSAKLETFPPEIQAQILREAHIEIGPQPPQQGAPGQPTPPGMSGAPRPQMGTPAAIPMPPPEQPVTAGAYAAAKGAPPRMV
jgi:hypothetical protein